MDGCCNSRSLITHFRVTYVVDRWVLQNIDSTSDVVKDLVGSCSIRSLLDGSRKPVTEAGTVTGRHLHEIGALVRQLDATEPQFVRCFLPNPTKEAMDRLTSSSSGSSSNRTASSLE
jgi:myosin heavy subunit